MLGGLRSWFHRHAETQATEHTATHMSAQPLRSSVFDRRFVLCDRHQVTTQQMQSIVLCAIVACDTYPQPDNFYMKQTIT